MYGGGPKLREALAKLPDSEQWFSRLGRIKYVSSALMTTGIVVFFVHALIPSFMSGFSWIFWIEYTGFFGFGLYWLRLMLFVNDANKAGRQMTSQAKRDLPGSPKSPDLPGSPDSPGSPDLPGSPDARDARAKPPSTGPRAGSPALEADRWQEIP
jgi:hypothetical protein